MCPMFTCIKLCPINNGQWNTMSQSWRIALVTYATQYIIVIICTKYTILKWSFCSRKNWCGGFLRVNNYHFFCFFWFLYFWINSGVWFMFPCLCWFVCRFPLWLFFEFFYLFKSLIFCNCFSTSDFRLSFPRFCLLVSVVVAYFWEKKLQVVLKMV